MEIPRVSDPKVWLQVKVLFLGSLLLFLINNYFGFDNALTPVGDIIPRWQILMHLHAGSIGWITLSVIGAVVWLFTGTREVSKSYVRGVQALSWAAILVFFGYIISFGLAFSQGDAYFRLLPVFGMSAAAVVWITAAFAFLQLRRQPAVTTVHLLLAGALLVVSVGALMGILLGLERVVGEFIPNLPADDRVGVHAGAMEVYQFLAASAVIEAIVRKDPAQRWSRGGLIQVVAWILAGISVPIFQVGGLPPEALLGFIVLLILGLLVFLVRIARLALTRLPLDAGPQSWAFFGSLWLIVFTGVFVYAGAVVLPDIANAPRWFGAVFQHTNFVGMTTNTLFGLYAARSLGAGRGLRIMTGLSMGLINLGLPIFFLTEILLDVRYWALLMGVGVVLGVVTMLVRVGLSNGGASAAPAAGS